MKIICLLVCIILSHTVCAQRGFYSGSRPRGYKDSFVPRIEDTINNRFDSQPTPVNTPDGRVPVNANNDIYLVNYLASLPREKQPFWFINYQLLEAQRNQPQPINTQAAGRSPFAGTGSNVASTSTSSSAAVQTNFNSGSQLSNRFDSGSSVPQEQRYGPFKVVVGVPPSRSNSLT